MCQLFPRTVFILAIQTHDKKKKKESGISQQKNRKIEQIEHEIDQLVYKLFSLTSEEIEIVENSNQK